MKSVFFACIFLITELSTSPVLAGQSTTDIFADIPTTQVNEQVYLIYGAAGNPSVKNKGFINNPAFVLVDGGVVVIDPGSSRAIGERVLERIARITPLPVIALFNTHEHGDHWLGNLAITEAYPAIPVYAHPNMIQAIADGAGEQWQSLMRQLTDNVITDHEFVAPTHPVENGDEIVLGNHVFRIHHYETSHTTGDIMIELPAMKTVFLGDNAFAGLMPRLDDGDVMGNIRTLRKIIKTQSRYYIPGHGPVGNEAVPRTYLSYLITLYDGVKRFYDEELSDFEMKDAIRTQMQDFSGWHGFEAELGRNISLVYLQIERDDF